MKTKSDFESNITEMCIARIPERMRLAHRFMMNRIDIHAFTYLEYDRPAGNTNYDLCLPEWLRGAPKFIYEHCLAQGFNPLIEPSDKPMSPGNEPKRVFSITIDVPPAKPQTK